MAVTALLLPRETLLRVLLVEGWVFLLGLSPINPPQKVICLLFFYYYLICFTSFQKSSSAGDVVTLRNPSRVSLSVRVTTACASAVKRGLAEGLV